MINSLSYFILFLVTISLNFETHYSAHNTIIYNETGYIRQKRYTHDILNTDKRMPKRKKKKQKKKEKQWLEIFTVMKIFLITFHLQAILTIMAK